MRWDRRNSIRYIPQFPVAAARILSKPRTWFVLIDQCLRVQRLLRSWSRVGRRLDCSRCPERSWSDAVGRKGVCLGSA